MTLINALPPQVHTAVTAHPRVGAVRIHHPAGAEDGRAQGLILSGLFRVIPWQMRFSG